MKIAFKTLVFIVPLMFMLCVDVVDERSLNVALVRKAEAIVGRPLTPMSAAGVARRTTRRVVGTTAVVATTAAASAPPPSTVVVVTSPPPAAPPASAVPIGTVVQALPGGCASVVVSGADYSNCGGVFYKAAFQGNNLVYVVVENPLK
jgi:hypothetical protein